jgi:hypothetical protein
MTLINSKRNSDTLHREGFMNVFDKFALNLL